MFVTTPIVGSVRRKEPSLSSASKRNRSPVAGLRAAPALVQIAPDQVGGLQTFPLEHGCDHRCRRRLAGRARDRDRSMRVGHGGDRLLTGPYRETGRASRSQLRVVLGDRARHHHGIRVAEADGVMSHADAGARGRELAQPVGVLQVRPRHLHPRARSNRARLRMPAPPMPTRCTAARRRGRAHRGSGSSRRAGRSARSSCSPPARGRRPARRRRAWPTRRRRTHRRAAIRIVDQRGDPVGETAGVSSWSRKTSAAPALELPGVRLLVVVGRVRVRDEDRGDPAGRELVHRVRPGARDGEIGDGEGELHPIEEGQDRHEEVHVEPRASATTASCAAPRGRGAGGRPVPRATGQRPRRSGPGAGRPGSPR